MPFRVSIRCECCTQRHTVYIEGEKLPPQNARVKFGCPKIPGEKRFTIMPLPKGELAPSIPDSGLVGKLLL